MTVEPLTGSEGIAFTEAQAAAIRDREGSAVLFANAGSGKTSVIVERFVQAIQSGMDPRGILAITFTEKAAGELRQRLRDRLVELGERGAARRAESAHVSTIHGFCQRVLRAHALEAGLDPSFRILGEAEGRRLREEAFAAALADFLDHADDEGPGRLELAAAYRPDRLGTLIATTYAKLRSRGRREPRLTVPCAPDPQHAVLEAAAAAAARELATASEGARVIAAREAVAACGALLGGLGPDELPPLAELAPLAFAAGGAAALGTDACAAYLAALAAYRQGVVDVLGARVCPLLDGLLATFGREYEARKHARAGLDFEDLELRTRDLFAERPAVRDAYARRFGLLMIDEFQDTNAVQLAVLAHLDRDNLLTVGDEFQSIYGFRHADVAIFQGRRAELDAVGRARSLPENFRSRPELIDALNGLFGAVFPSGFVPLVAGGPPPAAAAEPCVELLLTDERAWKDAEETLGDLPPGQAWRHAEARLLAQRVRDGVDAETWTAGEVVVLLRALGDLPVFEQALEDQGLPTYVAAGRGYWAAQPVQDVLAYLRVLANPRDEVRCFELLASPLVGLSSDGLAAVARARRGTGQGPWQALEAAFVAGAEESELRDRLGAADRAVLKEFCPWLDAERRAAPRRALDELIDRAVRTRAYDLHVLSLRDGDRRLANVRKLMRLAGEYEADEGRDLRGFLDAVALQEDAEAREGEAPVEREDFGAVRLMTIHGAKGLEFPVVCVADLGRQPANDTPDVHVGPDGEVGVRVVPLEGGRSVPALDYDDLQARRSAADAEEERRVFFVAMTRAERHLILSGGVRYGEWPEAGPARSPITWIGPALVPGIETALTDEHPVANLTAAGGVPVRAQLNRPATIGAVLRRDALAPRRERPHDPAAEAPPAGDVAAVPVTPVLPVAMVSYSGLEHFASCGYRYYLEKVLRLPADARAWAAAETGLPGVVRGTVVHTLLEHLDFAAPVTPAPAEIRALVAAAGVEASDDDVRDIAALVDAFARSPLCARLAAADRVRREAGFVFSLPMPPAARERLLVNGFIDFLGFEGEQALVVDYKSDRRVGERDLAAYVEAAYGTQRLVYALAALRAGAPAVEVVHVVLERPGEPVAASFAATDVPELEARIAALAQGIAGEDFTVTGEPNLWTCQGCPGRAALCSYDEDVTGREPAA